MRVLHVVTAFPRSPDDVIVPWLVELLVRLRARGWEAEVLTSAYRGGGNSEFRGIPVHRFRYFPGPWEDLTHDEAVPDRLRRGVRYRIAALSYVVAGMVAAWRLARTRRYDIVHVHWAMPHALLAWVARWAGAARIVTTFYGAELRWTRSVLGPLRWLLIRAARRSHQVVAISHHTARDVRATTGMHATVIPYGIALPSPAASAASAAAAASPFTILFVGRLVERKGVDVLLQAAARLHPKTDYRVIVVGDGPERPALETRSTELGLSGMLEFRGRVPAAELARAYRTSQALVLPAVLDRYGDTEGLGVVLLEAMAHGTPVIASEVGGITDIVTADQTGLLVPPGDPQALAAAIGRLRRDTELASRLRRAASHQVRERFGWDEIVQRWEAVYRAALQ